MLEEERIFHRKKSLAHTVYFFSSFKILFFIQTIFKLFVEFVTILFLFYVLILARRLEGS